MLPAEQVTGRKLDASITRRLNSSTVWIPRVQDRTDPDFQVGDRPCFRGVPATPEFLERVVSPLRAGRSRSLF